MHLSGRFAFILMKVRCWFDKWIHLGLAMSKRQRRWTLTLNNPTDAEYASVNKLETRYVKYAIFAQEVGEKGTPHIQGFIHFKNAKTLTATKKFLGSDRWHLIASNGTDYENREYCTKADEDAVEFGEIPLEHGPIDAWEDILQMVEGGFNNRQIVRKYPGIAIRCQAAIEKYRTEFEWAEMRAWRDVEVEYIAGPTGCGKSRKALYNDDGTVNTDVYRCTNAKNPFDKYDGESTIVFEEFRSQFTCRDMLNWIDGHPLLLPARYADRMAKFTKVIILSNWTFAEQYHTVMDSSPETYKAWQRRVSTITELWD